MRYYKGDEVTLITHRGLRLSMTLEEGMDVPMFFRYINPVGRRRRVGESITDCLVRLDRRPLLNHIKAAIGL